MRLKGILHPLIWVNIWLHFSPRRSSSITMFSLKTMSLYFTPYHLLWWNDMCLASLSFIFKTHLPNIKFQYGVYVIPTYSSLFLRLSYVSCSITWQFASKSNYHCKLRVTIRFIVFHNPFFVKICRSFYRLYGINCLNLICFPTYPF